MISSTIFGYENVSPKTRVSDIIHPQVSCNNPFYAKTILEQVDPFKKDNHSSLRKLLSKVLVSISYEENHLTKQGYLIKIEAILKSSFPQMKNLLIYIENFIENLDLLDSFILVNICSHFHPYSLTFNPLESNKRIKKLLSDPNFDKLSYYICKQKTFSIIGENNAEFLSNFIENYQTKSMNKWEKTRAAEIYNSLALKIHNKEQYLRALVNKN